MNTENFKSLGCVNFTQVNGGFILENDGNTLPTINLASDKNGTDATMFGSYFVRGGSLLQYKVTSNETDNATCDAGTVGPVAYTDVNITDLGTDICHHMNYQDANDTLRIDVQVNFLDLTTPGQKSAIFTASAS